MTKINRFSTLVLLLLAVCAVRAEAAIVDTALTHSAAMNRDIKAVVIKPADYSTNKKFPVLYLLHGFSGKYSDWILKVPSIIQLADRYDIIIICPDGGFAGWYFDSPVDKQSQYETYLAKELVNYVDGHYSTVKDRSGRAITGLSMGGHGALYLAFKHQDIYGAAGSMSGAVDLRPFADNFGIKQVLGTIKEYPERWEKNSVVNMVYLLKPNALAIVFDDGAEDFFFTVNNALHQKLLDQKIPHDYTSRPGAHTWEYWGNSINYQALFFSRFFNKEE
ncbi:MAG: xynZ 1 [Mucilaginibacter sp.]|nr:xynZ 1 [Mucilaginibacter sp.]